VGRPLQRWVVREEKGTSRCERVTVERAMIVGVCVEDSEREKGKGKGFCSSV